MQVIYQATNWQDRQFKQYHIRRLLKRDRLGTLWLAEEGQEQHLVVLRLLPSVAIDANEYLHLFQQIAQATSNLHHSHILPIYDSGVEPGQQNEAIPYLVYPYLEQATTLHAHLRHSGGILPTTDAFRYLYQAAQAIDYAHSQQVVHGGIHPACCLLDGPRLLLTDFCLTSLLTSDNTRSRTLRVDVPYLAPEQVQGKTEAASDRYSLAIMAYQIFTGRLPFDLPPSEGKNNPYDLLLQQLTFTPSPLPSHFNPQLSSPMEHVLLQALSRQPQQRYPSCSNLVDTLSRAWKGFPLDPHDDPNTTLPAPRNKRTLEQTHISQPEQTHLLHSDPTHILPSEQTPLALTSNMTTEKKLMAPMRLTPENSPAAPNENAITPQEKRSKSKLNRRAVLMIGGASAIALAAGGTALWWTMQPAAKLPPGPHQFTPGKILIHLTGHEEVITNVTWDASGHYLASASDDRRVMLWDISNILQKKPTTLQVMSHPTHKWKFANQISSNSLHWTTDGRKLIVSSTESEQFVLLDPFTDGDPRQAFSNSDMSDKKKIFTTYENVVPSPRSDLLAAIEYNQDSIKVLLWKETQPTRSVASLMQTVSQPNTNTPSNVVLVAIGWSSDGSMIAGLTNEMKLIVWDVKTHTVKKTLQLPVRPLKHDNPYLRRPLLLWSPIDPYVLAVAVIETIVVVDVHKEKPLYVLSTDNKDAYTPPANADTLPWGWVPQVFSFAWSPNGHYIVAGYSQAFTTMAVWDLLKKKDVRMDKEGGRLQDYLFPAPDTENAHSGSIFDISWSPNGRYLATGSMDKTILIWQVDASNT